MGGSSPKQHTSAAEEVNAKVGLAKKKFFNANLDPLNQMEMEDAATDKMKNTLRNRSAADAMQTMTANPQLSQVMDLGRAAEMSKGLQGQLGNATRKAGQIQNTRLAGAIGVAEGQQADNSQAMATLASLGASEQLQKMQNRELKRSSNMKAAGAVLGAGLQKKFGGEGKNNWFTKGRDGMASLKGAGLY